MDKKTAKPTMYMNVNTRAVYCAKPAHAVNPDMVTYYGEMPPIHETIGLRIVPQVDLGPEFAPLTDEEIRPKTVDKMIPVIDEDTPVDKIAEIVAAIDKMKPFDFTSAGIPKVDKLSFALGFPVTGAQRDEAFAMHLEAKSIED